MSRGEADLLEGDQPLHRRCGQHHLVEAGHGAAGERGVAALRHHRQPPRTAVLQHLQVRMHGCLAYSAPLGKLTTD